MFSCNIGILLVFILGNYCDYETTPKVVIVLALVFMVTFYFFPESPSVLMKQNRVSVSATAISNYFQDENIACVFFRNSLPKNRSDSIAGLVMAKQMITKCCNAK